MINADSGSDTLSLWASGDDSLVEVNGEANSDIINLGNSIFSLDSLAGSVFVNGNAHDTGSTILNIRGESNILDSGDTLNINDYGDTSNNSYVLDADTLQRDGSGLITYATVETLNINTGSGNDDIAILILRERCYAY